MTVNLTWTPGTGAANQTIQYKLKADTVWTDGPVVSNTTSSYQIVVPQGAYDFRIINSCIACLCPNGGEPNSQGQCIGPGTIPATPNGEIIEVARTPFYGYGASGTFVYNDLLGGGRQRINIQNTFWIRSQSSVDPLTGLPVTAANFESPFVDPNIKQRADLNNGPLNRLAIWGKQLINGEVRNNYNAGGMGPLNTWIGFSICINVPTTKTYYVGIGGDNYYRFSVDGTIVINANTDTTENFNYLHIYPVVLQAGNHIIKVEGNTFGGEAGFGCEIYDLYNLGGLTPFQFLQNQTSYNSSYRVIFTTRNVTTFTSNLTYSCPSGLTLSNANCQNATCSGTVTVACTNQPKSSNIISVGSRPITDFYTPCAVVSSVGNITAADIYLGPGVSDLAPGVQLYDIDFNPLVGVTLIASSTGIVYNVSDVTGIVGTANGDSC